VIIETNLSPDDIARLNEIARAREAADIIRFQTRKRTEPGKPASNNPPEMPERETL